MIGVTGFKSLFVLITFHWKVAGLSKRKKSGKTSWSKGIQNGHKPTVQIYASLCTCPSLTVTFVIGTCFASGISELMKQSKPIKWWKLAQETSWHSVEKTFSYWWLWTGAQVRQKLESWLTLKNHKIAQHFHNHRLNIELHLLSLQWR